MSVDHAIFDGPRSPARSFTPFLQWQSRILVPHHQPVCRRRFVEERRPERKCCSAKSLTRDFHEPRILSNGRDIRESHRMAHTSSTARQVDAAKYVEQSGNFFWLQDSRNYREPLCLNRLQPTQRIPPLKEFEKSLVRLTALVRQAFLPVPSRTRLRPARTDGVPVPRIEPTDVLFLCGTVRVDGGADDSHFIGGRDDLEAAALQRTHLNHFMQQPVQQGDIDELHVRPADEKCPRA